MYVGDASARAFEFVQRYGFRIVGPDCDSGRDHETVTLRSGSTVLVLTQGHTDEHPASEYVSRHGDGVADIALRVPDADRAMRMALAAGARPVARRIAAFGDVTHSFVAAAPLASGQHQSGAIQPPLVDHVAICLENGELDPTVDFYQQALGWRQIFAEDIDVGAQAMQSKVVQSWCGGITLTLLQPQASAAPGQIDDFLKSHGGSGVQHVALAVPDILRAVDDLSRRGVRFLTTPGTYYQELAERMRHPGHPINSLAQRSILADQDHDGQLFQIFTRSEHPRQTFFMEIIERQGAKTFGSNNIRKLYEAVERQRVAPARELAS